MSLKVGVEVDVEIDKRLMEHTRSFAIGDVYDALAELVTNSDDSYARLYASKVINHDGGKIIIEHLEQRKGEPSILIVRDRAEGMNDQDIEAKIRRAGRYESRPGNRGYMGRGAKDCSQLGKITFESIKDGRYYRARISHGLKFMWEAKGSTATPEQRRALGTKHHGTSVTIELLPTVKLPRIDTIATELPWHYALRDIMAHDSPSEVLIRHGSDGEPQALVYRQPEGDQLVDEVIGIAGYENAQARLRIWRAREPLEGDKPRFERCGILVKGRRAIHECSLLADEVRRDPAARHYFGRLECPFLDELLADSQDRQEKGLPPSAANPSLVIDPNRRFGLDRRHPFIKALLKEPVDRLRSLLAEEREREKSGRREVANRETRERLSKLAKLANRFLQNQLDDLEEVTADDAVDNESYMKRGVLLYPTYLRVAVGQERSLTFYARRSLLRNEDVEIAVKSDAPDAVEVHGSPFKPKIHGKKPDRLIGGFKIVGRKTHDSVIVTAVGAGLPEVEALVQVVADKKEDRAFRNPIEFERMEYRVREGRRRGLKLFAQIPGLVSGEVDVDVTSSDANRVAVRGKCRLLPVEGTNYAEGLVTVEGRTLKSSAQITATLNGATANTTVKVVERAESGAAVAFELRDQDFGENFRALWADREGKPNLLLISARHDSLKRYLGDPEKDYPGQNSPLFRVLLAEIVAESVCRKALRLEARERPFDFRWADMGKPEEIVDDVFFQFQQRQREFLARAHEIMLGQEELTAASGGPQ
jgi:hypothetical protein